MKATITNLHARRYLNRQGETLTYLQVSEILAKWNGDETGHDYLRVGQIYQNGSLWFQRDYDARGK